MKEFNRSYFWGNNIQDSNLKKIDTIDQWPNLMCIIAGICLSSQPTKVIEIFEIHEMC